MNSTNTSDSNGSKNYFVNFNQDSTSLAVGCRTGYRLYSLNSVEHLDQIYSNGGEDCCLVERLFSSSLVAVVSLTAPRKLKVCHFKKGTEICNYSYSNTILAVKLNRSRLVVCLEESLYIHNIRDMKVLHTIRDTPPNPQGLCALSINSGDCFLAYPGSSTIGEVQIFDAINLPFRAADSDRFGKGHRHPGVFVDGRLQAVRVPQGHETVRGHLLFGLRPLRTVPRLQQQHRNGARLQAGGAQGQP
ncbi:unnamed protein product [Callosobruchus maculatus]|uniref:WD repeat domain phosphoinositide-interacting protein 2 n=1 Tax=Callosobruchus maculatus TaxID=64391 RepID=A0A653CEA0_CALMS|nr:unnamed protein product [Callosobruchus maculatus]